jgi:SNF family Na+-dependent transporter
MVETVISAIYDELPRLRRHKGLVAIATSATGYLCGLYMCTRGGVYLFHVFDTYSAGFAVLILGLFEAVLVVYVYGERHKKNNKSIDQWVKRSNC